MGKIKRLIFLATIAVALPAFAEGPRVQFEPRSPLLDEVVNIKVTGLPPGEAVIIRAETVDVREHLFQSFAGFVADATGVVDLTQHESRGGSYEGIDPMGLFWSMDVAGEGHGRSTLSVPMVGTIQTMIDVEIDGVSIATADIDRVVVADGVTSEEVVNEGLVARLYRPAGKGPFPAVIVLGGSEGGLRSTMLTSGLLASRGFVALSLAYFSLQPTEGLPGDLVEIPLEYFDQAAAWLGAKPEVDPDRISIMGGSKGAEAALLVASHFNRFAAVVAYAPSSVVWVGPFSETERSSWSLDESPLPFARYQHDPAYRPPKGFPNELVRHYRYSFEKVPDLDTVSIPVERIDATVLLISGDDDRIWESTAMSARIIARARRYDSSATFKHLSYEHAGHSIGKAFLPTTWAPGANRRWPNGGTPMGNARAQAESWRFVLRFLEDAKRDSGS